MLNDTTVKFTKIHPSAHIITIFCVCGKNTSNPHSVTKQYSIINSNHMLFIRFPELTHLILNQYLSP